MRLERMSEQSPFETSQREIIEILKSEKRFVLMTHKDPDMDGLGSMLAFGKSLSDAQKDVCMLTPKAVNPPLVFLNGANRLTTRPPDFETDRDVLLALDCAEVKRLGSCQDFWNREKGLRVNIDHHESNTLFGRYNLVDPAASSTGEMVFELLKKGNFPMDEDIAENLFAAIKSDTGSFTYSNTTRAAFQASADLMAYGVRPWDISQRLIHGYGAVRLRLMELALASVEFHHDGQVGLMTLTKEMLKRAGARETDGEGFVDLPRFVQGVELGALVREKGKNAFKFSLRSNRWLNVAALAASFGGGGHVNAAGFSFEGEYGVVKRDFLAEAGRMLNAGP